MHGPASQKIKPRHTGEEFVAPKQACTQVCLAASVRARRRLTVAASTQGSSAGSQLRKGLAAAKRELTVNRYAHEDNIILFFHPHSPRAVFPRAPLEEGVILDEAVQAETVKLCQVRRVCDVVAHLGEEEEAGAKT